MLLFCPYLPKVYCTSMLMDPDFFLTVESQHYLGVCSRGDVK
jgi:hypothetical protein